jgi:diacylglycerol kinase
MFLGAFLKLSIIHWVCLILCFLLVWIAEFINSSIEAVVDLISPTKHPMAKISKDVSAAAVLIAAIGAAVVGLLILGPPLIRSFFQWIQT